MESNNQPDGVRARGLFEAHLTVADLDRSVAFYRDVVGLLPALELPDRGAAFLWVGEAGAAMLGLWSTGSMPMGLSLHIAFSASLQDVLGACARLRAIGVTPPSFFAQETDEPSVIGWMPAAAVYFRDPDGHLLEYLAMLDEAPRADVGIVSWSQWRRDSYRTRTGLARPSTVNSAASSDSSSEVTAVRVDGGAQSASRNTSSRAGRTPVRVSRA
jgi:lactoylglutathione lyase